MNPFWDDESAEINSIDYQNKSESVDILHFIGSKKPWYLSGIFYPGSEIYQENYQKIKNNTYHVVHYKLFLGSNTNWNVDNQRVVKRIVKQRPSEIAEANFRV